MKISKHIAVFLAAAMAYTPMAADSMAYSGKDIYTRSIEISKDMNSVSNVVLVNGEKNVDSLSGSVLANSKNASMLLIKKDYISPETLNEIKRINPEKIYILGGTETVLPKIQSELDKNYKTERIWGKDRYETSQKICENIFNEQQVSKMAVVGSQYDLLSAGSYCGSNIPILLINNRKPSYSYIDSKNVEKTVFGGPDSLSDTVYRHIGAVSRVYGKNRYETAVEIAKLRPDNKKAYIVESNNSIDAILLSTKAFNENADILLAGKYGLTPESRDYAKKYTDLTYTFKPEERPVEKPAVKIPTDRSGFEYWDYYNHYNRNVIMSQEQIKAKNRENINRSKYLNKVEDIKGEYGVISKRAVMKANPGGSTNSDRFDDYNALTGLFPWDEVAITKYSSDKKWAYVYCVDYQGWIPSDSIMKISREKMLELRNEPFVTMTIRRKYLPDGRMLDMGTYLPLKEETADSYKVYMPVTGNGYKVSEEVISKNEAVKGYLEFSQANVIKQALKFQGEPYGWGHSNSTRDCSGFIRDVYRSFGIVMARDTSKQSIDVIGRKTSFSSVKGQYQKEELMKKQMPGDAFYLQGHVFMYLGVDKNGRPHIVHQTGDIYVNGKKVRKFANEIADAKELTTPSHSALYFVTTGVSFLRGL